jgi:hypothetical protein
VILGEVTVELSSCKSSFSEFPFSHHSTIALYPPLRYVLALAARTERFNSAVTLMILVPDMFGSDPGPGSAIVAEDFRGFTQTFQANDGIVTQLSRNLSRGRDESRKRSAGTSGVRAEVEPSSSLFQV